MMWRVALTLMAVASLTYPAAAQWYPGWDAYSDRPYYGPRPYYDNRGYWDQPRRDPYDDGYDRYDRYAPDRGWGN